MIDVNETIRAVIANSANFDADTVEIDADGIVSALRDADKTLSGNDDTRYVVGHVSDMVDEDGAIREGYRPAGLRAP